MKVCFNNQQASSGNLIVCRNFLVSVFRPISLRERPPATTRSRPAYATRRSPNGHSRLPSTVGLPNKPLPSSERNPTVASKVSHYLRTHQPLCEQVAHGRGGRYDFGLACRVVSLYSGDGRSLFGSTTVLGSRG